MDQGTLVCGAGFGVVTPGVGFFFYKVTPDGNLETPQEYRHLTGDGCSRITLTATGEILQRLSAPHLHLFTLVIQVHDLESAGCSVDDDLWEGGKMKDGDETLTLKVAVPEDIVRQLLTPL